MLELHAPLYLPWRHMDLSPAGKEKYYKIHKRCCDHKSVCHRKDLISLAIPGNKLISKHHPIKDP